MLVWHNLKKKKEREERNCTLYTNRNVHSIPAKIELKDSFIAQITCPLGQMIFFSWFCFYLHWIWQAFYLEWTYGAIMKKNNSIEQGLPKPDKMLGEIHYMVIFPLSFA